MARLVTTAPILETTQSTMLNNETCLIHHTAQSPIRPTFNGVRMAWALRAASPVQHKCLYSNLSEHRKVQMAAVVGALASREELILLIPRTTSHRLTQICIHKHPCHDCAVRNRVWASCSQCSSIHVLRLARHSWPQCTRAAPWPRSQRIHKQKFHVRRLQLQITHISWSHDTPSTHHQNISMSAQSTSHTYSCGVRMTENDIALASASLQILEERERFPVLQDSEAQDAKECSICRMLTESE